MIRTPGGGAITAVGASRLGLSAAVAAPLGEDVAGDLVRGGAGRRGREVDRDAAGAAHADDGRDAVRRRPGDGHDRSRRPRLGRRRRRATRRGPSLRASTSSSSSRTGALAFVTCGDDDGRAYAGRPPAALDGCACALRQPARGARADGARRRWRTPGAVLAGLAETVVVTLAAEGAVAFGGGEVVRFACEPVDAAGRHDGRRRPAHRRLHLGRPPRRRPGRPAALGGAVRDPRRQHADR